MHVQARHPSALTKFQEIANASRGKKIVMFLDYDGTLAPIVENPDQAFMTNEVCLNLLYKLVYVYWFVVHN